MASDVSLLERAVAGSGAPPGTQSIVRIAGLLRLVASRNTRGMRLVEIAEAAELEQSTAHRIVSALAAVGFLVKDPATRRFHLGPLVFDLATTAVPDFNIRDLCHPALLRLVAGAGDTVYLTVRSGLDGVCVERLEGSYPIRACIVDVGCRRPLGIGAGSIALLASYPRPETETILRGNAERYLAFETTADAVRQSVEAARERGHVSQAVLSNSEVWTLGAAATGQTGHALAGFSITAIRRRMTEQHIAELVALLRTEVERTRAAISEQAHI